VTLEVVTQWEAQNAVDQQAGPLGLRVQQIWPALTNLETGDHQRTRAVFRPGTREMFRVSTWRENPEYTIEVPMEYDLVNQRWLGTP
jgi:hypothetical protein